MVRMYSVGTEETVLRKFRKEKARPVWQFNIRKETAIDPHMRHMFEETFDRGRFRGCATFSPIYARCREDPLGYSRLGLVE